MGKGDKVYINGQPHTVLWTSDDMTDAERYEAHMKTADFMEQYGLSGDFQRALAARCLAGIETGTAETAKQGSVPKG